MVVTSLNPFMISLSCIKFCGPLDHITSFVSKQTKSEKKLYFNFRNDFIYTRTVKKNFLPINNFKPQKTLKQF